MRSLVLSSIACGLLFSSCAPEMLKGFRKTGEASLSKVDFYPFFHEADSVHLFNMQIDYRKNHFSGMFVVKCVEENRFRTAFNTYFGVNVFDFEFNGDTFLVHNCMESLNKKRVIQTLESDLKILFLLNLKPDGNAAGIYLDGRRGEMEINKAGDYYYLKNTERKELLQIEIPRFFSSLHYRFEDYREHFPANIRIKHSNIGLKIQLEKTYNNQ
jgi:hypothetical protein